MTAHQIAPSVDRLALSATVHCLTGCAIGEILGLAIASQLGWPDLPSIGLAVLLAFVFGYALTLRPLFASGVAIGSALRLAFAADTLSITVMEIVDNAIVLAIPGAMDAGIVDALFWGQPGAGARRRGCRGVPGEPLAHPTRTWPRGAPRAPPLTTPVLTRSRVSLGTGERSRG